MRFAPGFRFLSFFAALALGYLSACLTNPSGPPAQEPATITLSTYRIVLTAINEHVRIDATVLDQDGRVISDATVNWRSADNNVARVSDRGVVTVAGSGMTQIIVTSGYATASATISVEQSAYRIEIMPSSIWLVVAGRTSQLMALVYDSGNRVIPGVAVVWSSSNPETATVDANGLVTAVSDGWARVTASSGDASAHALIHVFIGGSEPPEPPPPEPPEPPPPEPPPETSSDRDVLVALYNATDGPNWTHNTNWLSEVPLKDWYGVSTDADGRVTWLELLDNGLSGVIPPEIGRLNNLSVLYLQSNQLTGTIPSEIGQLSDLNVLLLSHNHLTGTIPPEIGRLNNLIGLYLGGTRLSGPLPLSLTNIRLRVLSLESTRLCVPAEPVFQTWLDGISIRFGVNECPPAP